MSTMMRCAGGTRRSRTFGRTARSRRHPARRGLSLEQLESRQLLSADGCYANLFAGPRLVSVDSNESELLEGVFNALLPGSHVDLTVADWNAVGAGHVNLNRFLTSLQADLGVSSPNQALAGELTLARIFAATAGAVPADGDTADLHAALLNLRSDVDVGELSGTIRLADLLQITFPDGSFANVDLNALHFVTGVIQLYNYENVLTTNDPVTLSGTLFNDPTVQTVELWAQVIEPPIIDPVVYAGDQFYSAAIRIKLDVDLVDLTVAGTNVTISEMSLYVDVARAQGEVVAVASDSSLSPAVTIQASHGVTHLYLGEISDSLFFNRTRAINPQTDLGYGTIGSVTGSLGQLLSVEAKGYAEGTAPISTLLEFFVPFPESQTTGTSTAFIATAVGDLLTSLQARVTLAGIPVSDPTTGIRAIVADAIDAPLTRVLVNVGDPLLDHLGTGIGEMDVTINRTNCPPVANDDSVTVNEDKRLVVAAPGVLANDHDPDGDPLTAVLVAGPNHGTVTLNANGSFAYKPVLNYHGSDRFTYKAKDPSDALSNLATVNITVLPVNDAPVARNDSYSTPEDTTLIVAAPGILANDRDVDGDPLTAVLVSGPTYGVLTLQADGSFTYTPAAGYAGPDSFTYNAQDPSGALSKLATVSINVLRTNRAPVAADDAYTTNEDTPLVVIAPGVLANDHDPDGDPLTAVLVAGPSHGTVTLKANGAFTYRPAANYHGPDRFTYKAKDPSGALSNLATVSITVLSVNDAPIARNDFYSTPEDTTLIVAAPGILANDGDVDGDPLTAVLVSGPTQGVLTLQADGSFTYTPALNYNGPDSYTYKAKDPSGALSNVATVNINVKPVNDPPVAVNDAYSTDEDVALIVAAPGVLANDNDVEGDPLTSILVKGPDYGQLTFNSNGSFTYTPAADYNGPDAFTYKAHDGKAFSNVATVSITVHPVDDVPDSCYANLFAGPRLVSVDSNESELLEGVFNALLPGSHVDLTVADWNAVGAGHVNLNRFLTSLQADLGVSSPNQALAAELTLARIFGATAGAIPADGDTAALHAALLNLSSDVDVGELSGTIRLADLLQITFPDGSFANVDLNALHFVTGVIELYNYENVLTTNDPVTLSGTLFNDPTVQTVELWAQVIEPPIIDPVVYAGDQFYSAAIRIKLDVDLVDLTVAGTNVTISEMSLYVDVARAQGEVVAVQSDSSLSPAVAIQASHGVTHLYLGEISDSLFFNRTRAINPQTDLGYGTIGSVTGSLGQLLSVEAKGYAEGTAPISTLLEFFVPFPESQTTGTSTAFIATAVGDLLTSLQARVTLAGIPVSDPTTGIRAIVADAIDAPLIRVLVNVGDPLLDHLGTGIGEMDVTINRTNCPPVANDDSVTVNEDKRLVVAAPGVLANDHDPDGDPLTAVLVIRPSRGTLTLNADGSFVYKPALNYHGPDRFTYKAKDADGVLSNLATVNITVLPVNDAPVARNDSYSTNENTTLTVAAPGILANDRDVDGDPLTAVLVSGPTYGVLTLQADGSFVYTPHLNYHGSDSFTYKTQDSSGALSKIGTVSITVNEDWHDLTEAAFEDEEFVAELI